MPPNILAIFSLDKRQETRPIGRQDPGVPLRQDPAQEPRHQRGLHRRTRSTRCSQSSWLRSVERQQPLGGPHFARCGPQPLQERTQSGRLGLVPLSYDQRDLRAASCGAGQRARERERHLGGPLQRRHAIGDKEQGGELAASVAEHQAMQRRASASLHARTTSTLRPSGESTTWLAVRSLTEAAALR